MGWQLRRSSLCRLEQPRAEIGWSRVTTLVQQRFVHVLNYDEIRQVQPLEVIGAATGDSDGGVVVRLRVRTRVSAPAIDAGGRDTASRRGARNKHSDMLECYHAENDQGVVEVALGMTKLKTSCQREDVAKWSSAHEKMHRRGCQSRRSARGAMWFRGGSCEQNITR